MSFLRPDNNTQPEPDNTAATAVQDDNNAQAMQDPSQQPANDANQTANDASQPDQPAFASNDEDVTVTTNEGSTLHTFNDPTLQNPNDPTTDQASNPFMTAETSTDGLADLSATDDATNGVNDALSFQDNDGSPMVSSDSMDSSSTASPVVEIPDNPADEPIPEAPIESISMDTPESALGVPSLSTNPELDEIKKQALEQLRPLLEKVDLPAGEKFDKYLMMLRATDDPTLIEPAFNAAQAITEDKDKAEALVDIINEINYVSGGEHTDQ